jgi:DNA-binding XRE family transcriptional regulator
MRRNLKEAREQAGYNQQQFADAVGVRRQTVTEWETKECSLSMSRSLRDWHILPHPFKG